MKIIILSKNIMQERYATLAILSSKEIKPGPGHCKHGLIIYSMLIYVTLKNNLMNTEALFRLWNQQKPNPLLPLLTTLLITLSLILVTSPHK